MKKFAALAMILSLGLFTVAGCGRPTSKTPVIPPPPTDTDQAAGAAEGEKAPESAKPAEKAPGGKMPAEAK